MLMPISHTVTGEAEIRTLIDARVEAVRSKNAAGATAPIAPDVVLFDVVNPLRYVGSDALRKRAEEWFASFEGPIGFEIRDLNIAAAGDVAFSYGLNRVYATTKDGNKLDMWWRSTVCYRKINGKWQVMHEHNSAPFDPETGKASLDLRP
jgi:uncharacterized protein (TIGR02246 family)